MDFQSFCLGFGSLQKHTFEFTSRPDGDTNLYQYPNAWSASNDLASRGSTTSASDPSRRSGLERTTDSPISTTTSLSPFLDANIVVGGSIGQSLDAVSRFSRTTAPTNTGIYCAWQQEKQYQPTQITGLASSPIRYG